jgi:hypothetical protein
MMKSRSYVDRFSLFYIYHLFPLVYEGQINTHGRAPNLLLFATSRGG